MTGTKKNSGGEGTVRAAHQVAAADPMAIFLSDPESHLSDILYLYFRIYKKKLLWRFFQTALAELSRTQYRTLFIADVGASMGFDVLYLLRKLTGNFRGQLPCEKVRLSLVEGDQKLIAAGERTLRMLFAEAPVEFRYYHYPLVEGLPLPDGSHHLAICSEVVEHMDEPEKLLREIFRVLKPGGFLMLTTDNSPSLLQHIRRIPVWLSGNYQKSYTRPAKELETVGKISWNGCEYPIFGHINLNTTRHWERVCTNVGFELTAYGTYESIRRGGGSKSALALCGYFTIGALVHALPRSIGRFFGDTTALLLRRPIS